MRIASLVVAMLVIVSLTQADEPKDLDKIPKAVMEALKAKFPKAKIEKWTKEKEDGKEIYDIEFTVNGKKTEADIAADGTILNFEEEFPAKDLPKAVTDAVAKRYPKSTIQEVMKITEIEDKKEVNVPHHHGWRGDTRVGCEDGSRTILLQRSSRDNLLRRIQSRWFANRDERKRQHGANLGRGLGS
jgi:hypothetical protein